MPRILFLVPYPPKESPSQRFRFEQYLGFLTNEGYKLRIQSFLPERSWRIFYTPGNALKKTGLLIQGFARRFFILFTIPSYDRIFIHRETAPVGPPVVEWLIAKVFRKKIIYDFDDAIWLTDKKKENRLEQALRCRAKVSAICRWSHVISCGNEYLRQHALRFNPNAVLNPTTVDTENVHNPALRSNRSGTGERLLIAWTGSHSTLKYLYLLEKVLRDVQRKFVHVDLLVIADKPPEMHLPRIVFRPWSNETEIMDLIQADIGIMPLPDDEWSKGKCGFKALQYMALEIPAVASNVGVNPVIIQDGRNGLLCANDGEWQSALEELITNPAWRKQLGLAGRETVTEHYSVSSNSENFLSLFVR